MSDQAAPPAPDAPFAWSYYCCRTLPSHITRTRRGEPAPTVCPQCGAEILRPTSRRLRAIDGDRDV